MTKKKPSNSTEAQQPARTWVKAGLWYREIVKGGKDEDRPLPPPFYLKKPTPKK